MYTVCVVPGSVFSESVYIDNYYKNTYTALRLIATTVYRSVQIIHTKNFLPYCTVTSGIWELDQPFPLRTCVYYNTLSKLNRDSTIFMCSTWRQKYCLKCITTALTYSPVVTLCMHVCVYVYIYTWLLGFSTVNVCVGVEEVFCAHSRPANTTTPVWD